MIDRVVIENFRAIRKLDVQLKPLTVLVGPNDTGKSSFLHAVNFCKVREYADSDRYRSQFQPIVEFFDAGVKFHIAPPGKLSFPPHKIPLPLIYQLPHSGPKMEGPGQPDQEAARFLASNGEGVPRLVDYLLRRDPDRLAKFKESVKKLVPGIEDIFVEIPQEVANRRLFLQIDGAFQLPADLASAGIRFMLFFVALAYHPRRPDIIMIEEPETGLHPKRLIDVMNLLRGLTDGKLGDKPAQVILTTHSPYLLDLVDLSKDQVLVFRREPDGSRTAEAADAERLKDFLDEFMLGEVWFNEGEEGLVGHKLP